MTSKIIRLGALGSLIILCIWQIIRLWLGDMSSHTFFTDTPQSVVVKPKEVWVNYNGLAYKVTGKSGEIKGNLVSELSEAIKNGNYSISKVEGLKYENLLRKEVFVYEYGTSLRFEDIFGYRCSDETTFNRADTSNKLVINLQDSLHEVYMLDLEDNINVVIRFNESLSLHSRMKEHYTNTDIISDIKTYQASILNNNYKNKFDKNIFYPLDNINRPLKTEMIKLEPIITGEGEYKLEQIKSSIAGMFKDPNSMNINLVGDGIVFNDALDMNVFYGYDGYIEVNKRYIESATKFTTKDDLKIVSEFIDESSSISESIKSGLYLKDIKENMNTGEVVYGYGYRYNGFEVIMSNEIINNLGSPYFVEVGVRQNQITYGKWIMYDVVELAEDIAYIDSDGYAAIIKGQNAYDTDKLNSTPLSDIQCAYIIDSFDKDIVFDWISLYKGKWYY